jgi:hypothetical protein
MLLNKETEQDNFWLSVKGQHVRVPYLPNLFLSWKAKLHPDYERARDEVLNPWIRTWDTRHDIFCRSCRSSLTPADGLTMT